MTISKEELGRIRAENLFWDQKINDGAWNRHPSMVGWLVEAMPAFQRNYEMNDETMEKVIQGIPDILRNSPGIPSHRQEIRTAWEKIKAERQEQNK